MPARIAVRLSPTSTRHPPVPPRHTGPAVNAAFLGALRDAGEPELATALHEPRRPDRPKPYALTPLVDEHDGLANASSTQVRFEVGVLADPLTAHVLQALTETTRLRVARCVYRVAAVELLGAEPYPELLAGARPCERWDLDVRTPAAFFTAREEGARRARPFPEAEWVLAALHRRWQALAPEPAALLDDAVAQTIARHMEVVDHRLTMAEHLVKAGVEPRRGSLGTVAYQVADAHQISTATLTSLDALIRFSAYAGIGDRTVVGMGYVMPSFGPPRPRDPVR